MNALPEDKAILEEIASQNVNEKGFVTDEFRTKVMRHLRVKNENRTCFDCPARNPTWISLSHANFVCLDCSGEHRRMGVHISFVRSIELDSFLPDQLVQMVIGGNKKARDFFKQCGIEAKRKEKTTGYRSVDYFDKTAAKYRHLLEKEVFEMCLDLGIDKEKKKTLRISGGPPSPMNVVSPQRNSSKDDDNGFFSSAGGAMPKNDLLVKEDNTSTIPTAAPGTLVLNLPTKDSNTSQKSTPKAATTATTQQANPFVFNLPSTGASSGQHFAAGSKKKPKAKAKKLDADIDFDFGAFEKEAARELTQAEKDEQERKKKNPFVLNTAPSYTGTPGTTTAPPDEMTTFAAPVKKATPGGFIDDDDEVFGMPKTANGNANGNGSNGNPSSLVNKPNPFAPVDTSKFADKRAFGSDQLFGDASPGGQESAVSKFGGQQAFGSDAMFGRESQRKPGDEWQEKAADKLIEAGEKAKEKFTEVFGQGKDKLTKFFAKS